MAVSCSSGSGPKNQGDAGTKTRVFERPVGKARAIPPYNIHGEGVGPYVLDHSLREVLSLLPKGPRLELVQLGDANDFSLVRSDGGDLVIGAARGSIVSFISVLRAEVARTETGLGVGQTLVDWRKSYGEPTQEDVSDRRIVHLPGAPNLDLITDGTTVRALLLHAPADKAPWGLPKPQKSPQNKHCPAKLSELKDFKDPKLARAQLIWLCVGGEAEPIFALRDEVVLYTGEASKAKKINSLPIPGLRTIGEVYLEGETKPMLVALSRRDKVDSLVARVDLMSLENGRLALRGGLDAYTLSSASLAQIGAKPSEVDVLLKVLATGDTLEIGGIYLHEVGRVIRDAIPLSPVTIPIQHRKKAANSDNVPPAKTPESGRPDASDM